MDWKMPGARVRDEERFSEAGATRGDRSEEKVGPQARDWDLKASKCGGTVWEGALEGRDLAKKVTIRRASLPLEDES